jgi:flagellin
MVSISSTSSSLSGLNKAQSDRDRQQAQISSGKRIQSAKDDAAGLSIATRLDAQIASGMAARRNSLDGISRLQVEDGALAGVGDQLQRIRELKVQQGNGILSQQDQDAIQKEIDQRLESIDEQTQQAQFNGQPIFEAGTLSFQVGENAGQTIDFSSQDVSSQLKTLGVEKGNDLSIDQLDQALSFLAERRSEVGAVSNRLASQESFQSLKNNQNQASSSRIQDADIAQAVSKQASADIQQKVAISVQSQANLNKGFVLDLLKK